MKLSNDELVIMSYALGDVIFNYTWSEKVRNDAEALYGRVNEELSEDVGGQDGD